MNVFDISLKGYFGAGRRELKNVDGFQTKLLVKPDYREINIQHRGKFSKAEKQFRAAKKKFSEK